MSSNGNGNDSEEKKISDIYVRFIDILFAVVIGQSFVLINSETNFRPWFAKPLENAFGIATILLVYGLVITSWIGYHRSTHVFPIRRPFRFVIDIVLLFFYYMGFVNAGDFELVTWVFFITFLLYVLWDVFRLAEYYDKKDSLRELLKRLVISAVFAGVFFAVVEMFIYLKASVAGIQWAFFVVILFLLILYRYLKWYRNQRVSSVNKGHLFVK